MLVFEQFVKLRDAWERTWRFWIRGIIEQTGVKIEVEDGGTVHVSSTDEAAANKALQISGDITAVAEVGKTYLGKVVRLVDFGAFVEILPRH